MCIRIVLQVDLRHMDEKVGSNIVDVGVDLSEFYMSVEWDILEVPAVRYGFCDNNNDNDRNENPLDPAVLSAATRDGVLIFFSFFFFLFAFIFFFVSRYFPVKRLINYSTLRSVRSRMHTEWYRHTIITVSGTVFVLCSVYHYGVLYVRIFFFFLKLPVTDHDLFEIARNNIVAT